MLPRFGNMRIRHAVLAGVIVTGGFAGTAWALPKPMTLAPIYDNMIPSNVKLAKGAIACPVRILALDDIRRSPEMVGVHDRRQIFAPQDRAAWLRSIMAGLKSRGVLLSFESEPNATRATTAKVDLTTAWITNTKVNISASAVFRMQVISASGETFDRTYRGGNSRMTYWTNGRPVLQQAIDVAFARALDAMAVDLLTTCKAPA